MFVLKIENLIFFFIVILRVFGFLPYASFIHPRTNDLVKLAEYAKQEYLECGCTRTDHLSVYICVCDV